MDNEILCIGGGNMGRAIIGGLLATGYAKDRISVVDPDRGSRERLEREFGIATFADAPAGARADVVLLAVKPQVMSEVTAALAEKGVAPDAVYVSIAAGITTARLAQTLGAGTAIVRVMPNTPALVGQGAAAMFANDNVDARGREAAAAILEAVGIARWVDDEADLDAVTALSGSGPAYFFLILEILERAGTRLGLDPELARELAIETAHGAALLARSSSEDPATLREQVTSPGGTTEAALGVLTERGIEAIFSDALSAAHARSIELARDAGTV